MTSIQLRFSNDERSSVDEYRFIELRFMALRVTLHHFHLRVIQRSKLVFLMLNYE
jgi:hypothetical protein